jgi:hypothetical protein
VDGLARAFTSKPVIFLQYETDSFLAVNRIDRFYAAWQLDKSDRESEPSTPYTMVDSGRYISYGERDFQREYRRMIDNEVPRPPTALIYAQREMPSPTTLNVKVQVTNISTATLLSPVNGAMLHLVLYEGTKALKTGSDIHAMRQATFETPLAPGETRLFDFAFADMRGVNLTRADALAMLDYRPVWGKGRYDMMQAAVARKEALPPTPEPWPTETPTPTDTPVPPPSPTPTDVPPLAATPRPPGIAIFMPYLSSLARMGR